MSAVEGGQGSIAVSADGAFSSGAGDSAFGGFEGLNSVGFSPVFSSNSGAGAGGGVSPWLIAGGVLAVVVVLIVRGR